MSYAKATAAVSEPAPTAAAGRTLHPEPGFDPAAFDLIERHVARELDDADPAHGLLATPQPNGRLNPQLSTVYPIVRSLYMALAYRDGATAKHSWRVAGCLYHFAHHLGFERHDRLVLEVAGLLHDIGKIGVPDSILLKPATLSPDELAVMDEHHRLSIEIIRPTIPIPRVIDAVDHSHAWFDGSRKGFSRCGDQMPLGARMLAIADAYDAMTTDRVYRRAMSQEAALAELGDLAGRQFDPRLVDRFQKFLAAGPPDGPAEGFSSEIRAIIDRLPSRPGQHLPAALELYVRVLNDLYDGVCFINTEAQLLFWNDTAEKLTGYSARELCERTWGSLEELYAALVVTPPGHACPLRACMLDAAPRLEQVVLRHKSGEQIPVAIHLIPIVGGMGDVVGVAQLFRDVRDKVALEMECRELATLATQDSLTGLANRAELDGRLPTLISEHALQGEVCSVIVADLDHFKEINDTYGHQCGDQVLKTFARVLLSHSRPSDLVARYGGEEFVLVLSHMPLDVAWGRAEAMRSAIAAWRTPLLDNRAVTASFGLTELRQGDTAEPLLRRADRALYMAKQQGRNRSVKINADGELLEKTRLELPPTSDGSVQEVLFISSVGHTVHLKLAGFAADHGGRIVTSTREAVRIRIGGRGLARFFGTPRQRIPVEITLTFRQAREQNRLAVQTCIKPTAPVRFHDVAYAYCVELFASLRAHLLAD